VASYLKKYLMNINSLIEGGATIQIVVTPLDLREAFLQWSEEANAGMSRKPEKYLTAQETADRLGVDISTLWRWNRSGYLRKIKVGAKPMYRESDIEKLMEG